MGGLDSGKLYKIDWNSFQALNFYIAVLVHLWWKNCWQLTKKKKMIRKKKKPVDYAITGAHSKWQVVSTDTF